MSELKILQHFIKTTHGCDSEHLDSIPVHLVAGKKIVLWHGIVEVFTLLGHAQAKRCYAWSNLQGESNGQQRHVAILEMPPIDTPTKAVRAALVRDSKSQQT